MLSRERAPATLVLVLSQPASRIPTRHRSVRFQRRQRHAPKSALAVNENALVIAEIAEFVRLDSVLLSLGVVDAAPAGAVAPGPFHDTSFAEEVGGLNGIGFVGGTENYPVTKIQCEHFRFVVAQGREERGSGLRGGDNGGSRFANHVHTVVVAGAVLAGGHESLGLVSPEDNEIVLGTLDFGLVETAQGVIVKQQLEERVNVTSLCLELLRHCCQDDSALVNEGKIERAFAGAKHLGHLGRKEVLQVIANGFTNPAQLFFRLFEETIGEVLPNGQPAGRFVEFRKVLLRLFQCLLVGKKCSGDSQRNRAAYLE